MRVAKRPEELSVGLLEASAAKERTEGVQLLARTKRAAYENGATLIGDERSGRFSHDLIKGDYRMVGQTVLVTITEKHWLVPWPVVEFQLGALVR